MHVRHLLSCLFLLLSLAAAAFAQQGNIRFDSVAEIETIIVDERGEKILQRQPATLVVPGTTVIYTNLFTNTGQEPATGILITNPVPERMSYLAGSALGEGAVITFSVDGGKTFGAPEQLTITGPSGEPRPAEAADYTHIRWRLQEPLPPGAMGRVEFRAQLK